MGKTSIIALSGPSSSGKTTLARLLQQIFSNQPTAQEEAQTAQQPQSQDRKQISTFIIHEDDFYQPDDKIPSTTLPTGKTIQDWDCLGALDIPFLSSALTYVHEKGHLPPRLRSKEDLNDVSPGIGVDESLVEGLRGVVEARIRRLYSGGKGEGVTLALLEGFLLYAPPTETESSHGLRNVHDQIDVRIFLPAPYDLVKERREKRSGYVTIGPAPELPQRSSVSGGDGEVDLEAEDDRPPQNFWTDPPGYVDDIVWPRYVRDHAWLLLPEEDQGESLVSVKDDAELVKRVGQGVKVRTDAGVTVAPGQGSLPMADLLKWAVEEVLKYLEQQYSK
ncbi:ribosylnicotinamide kinase [Aspergillus undulatus]|uniref:ribosylnicotinamide kinase n=1 Tax=Aspergillus undulatus TaxID=1810928 RepID=UPI003CCCBF22